MSTDRGRVVGVNGAMVTVEFASKVMQNEVAWVSVEGVELPAEVIRVRGRYADVQVFEDTSGLAVGDAVTFLGHMLSVELGPGLLSQIFDGLQNPLPAIAETHGFFLPRGVRMPALDRDVQWQFTPQVQAGDEVVAADTLGTVPEGLFVHRVMVPFSWEGSYRVKKVVPAGSYRIEDEIAVLERIGADPAGGGGDGDELTVNMVQRWPVKRPITLYAERLRPTEQLITKMRILDSFFPVAKGGTYCIPGPFGAGKTVLQQLTSRHADVDVVVIAACGERAGEVVETLREFPELIDERTGRSLMERTIIICNTSSMPVAAREASVYTAVTLAEYYRQMGLQVLLLADSTSRWAQAMREMSGRLEEIPGQEAFPAYLESVIAAFYERAGRVRLNDGSIGSVTIGGTVSPAGGDFEEPVTQSTLKVVGAFHALSQARADARRYPAIDPLESWSKYGSVVEAGELAAARRILRQGREVWEMMKVVEEEGTSMDDFVTYLKAEYLDAAYLRQDAYDPVDGASSAQRQRLVFSVVYKILATPMAFESKAEARRFFQDLTQVSRDWNRAEQGTEEFRALKERLEEMRAKAVGDV